MVSVCATCKGLQKHLRGLDGPLETETGTLQWIATSLPSLRTSSSGCRACALILNGILLHHDRFAGQKEDGITIVAVSLSSKLGRTLQDHLSVEVRWKEPDGDNDEQEHSTGYPDLKLEFFTDGGMRPPL